MEELQSREDDLSTRLGDALTVNSAPRAGKISAKPARTKSPISPVAERKAEVETDQKRLLTALQEQLAETARVNKHLEERLRRAEEILGRTPQSSQKASGGALPSEHALLSDAPALGLMDTSGGAGLAAPPPQSAPLPPQSAPPLPLELGAAASAPGAGPRAESDTVFSERLVAVVPLGAGRPGGGEQATGPPYPLDPNHYTHPYARPQESAWGFEGGSGPAGWAPPPPKAASQWQPPMPQVAASRGRWAHAHADQVLEAGSDGAWYAGTPRGGHAVPWSQQQPKQLRRGGGAAYQWSGGARERARVDSSELMDEDEEGGVAEETMPWRQGRPFRYGLPEEREERHARGRDVGGPRASAVGGGGGPGGSSGSGGSLEVQALLVDVGLSGYEQVLARNGWDSMDRLQLIREADLVRACRTPPTQCRVA